MQNNDIIFFFFDVDEQGLPTVDVDILSQMVQALSKIFKDEKTIIFLPRGINYKFYDKPHAIEVLKDILERLEEDNDDKKFKTLYGRFD